MYFFPSLVVENEQINILPCTMKYVLDNQALELVLVSPFSLHINQVLTVLDLCARSWKILGFIWVFVWARGSFGCYFYWFFYFLNYFKKLCLFWYSEIRFWYCLDEGITWYWFWRSVYLCSDFRLRWNLVPKESWRRNCIWVLYFSSN